MRDYGCGCGADANDADASDGANTRIRQDHGDVPQVGTCVELRLIGGQPIGDMVTEEQIGNGLRLQCRDMRCGVCRHKLRCSQRAIVITS